MQIFQTSSDISTPEKLAALLSNQAIARYKDLPPGIRKAWIGTQVYALSLILHYQTPNPMDVEIDSAFADQIIMEDEVASLRQVEMQEAFRRGIAKEYGDFYGITPATLLQFLKGYRASEKRQQAIAILYAKEKEETISQEKRLEYELRAHGLQLPFWKSARDKKTVTREESEEHRKKIALQRETILKSQDHAGQE